MLGGPARTEAEVKRFRRAAERYRPDFAVLVTQMGWTCNAASGIHYEWRIELSMVM